MICALCQLDFRELKKNTHYLTDSIIRTCLNLDASTGREKGYYFGLFNDHITADFNFQRNTSIPAVENALGREATDEEIQKAKKIPFSVDDVFCASCESIFTNIETNFSAHVIPLFRDADLSGKLTQTILDVKLVRLFFYLQLWRTAVCHAKFTLPPPVKEYLRVAILDHSSRQASSLTHYPLSITYLETKIDQGTGQDYTNNYIAIFQNLTNPYVIFMNDFVIQFHTETTCDFNPIYGLNDNDYKSFINFQEEEFLIRIVPDAMRQTVLANLRNKERIIPVKKQWADVITKRWQEHFGTPPGDQVIEEYIRAITENSTVDLAIKYSPEILKQVTDNFMLIKSQELL